MSCVELFYHIFFILYLLKCYRQLLHNKDWKLSFYFLLTMPSGIGSVQRQVQKPVIYDSHCSLDSRELPNRLVLSEFQLSVHSLQQKLDIYRIFLGEIYMPKELSFFYAKQEFWESIFLILLPKSSSNSTHKAELLQCFWVHKKFISGQISIIFQIPNLLYS